MDLDATHGFESEGALNAWIHRGVADEPSPIGADTTLEFLQDGPVCPGCGAHNPSSAAACIVCGKDLHGPLAYRILGTSLPALELTLGAGQRVYAETRSLGWMSDEVQMQTPVANSPWAMLGRAASGMTPLITEFFVENGQGLLALTTRTPGSILPLSVDSDRSYVLQRGAFLAAQTSVTLAPSFQQNLGTIFFGGEGFVLQHVSGSGQVFAQIDGEVAEHQLEPGKSLWVDPGSIAVFELSVDFRLSRVEGVANVLFSQGLFLAELRGSGSVWLQTLPFARLMATIAAHLPKERKQRGRARAGPACPAGASSGSRRSRTRYLSATADPARR